VNTVEKAPISNMKETEGPDALRDEDMGNIGGALRICIAVDAMLIFIFTVTFIVIRHCA
jgi:hypothetical protein